MSKRLFAAALLAAALWAQTAQAPVPVAQEHHHHLIMDNDYVRVYDVRVAPHEATLVHQHDLDYAYVVLGDSKITNAVVGKPPVDADLPDGTASFSKGGFAHAAINRADTPFRNVTIEFKLPEHEYGCGIARGLGCGQETDWQVKALFITDQVLATMLTIPASGATHVRTYEKPRLIVALDDMAVEEDIQGQAPRVSSMNKGQAVFSTDRITRELKNVGTKPVRLLILEFEPIAGKRVAPPPKGLVGSGDDVTHGCRRGLPAIRRLGGSRLMLPGAPHLRSKCGSFPCSAGIKPSPCDAINCKLQIANYKSCAPHAALCHAVASGESS